MIAVTYRIYLTEPALFTAPAGDPNSSVSYPFVPGSTVRGLVARVLAARQVDQDLPHSNRDLLFNGKVRFLNAYLTDAQGKRRLPVPLSWRKEKSRMSDTGRIEDHALMDSGNSQLTTPETLTGYVAQYETEVNLVAAQREIRVHTYRDRHAGRPTENLGALFQYDSLAAGQWFAGAVISPSQEVAQSIKDLLADSDYILGGSSSAGYGLVRLVGAQVDLNWQETHGRIRPIKSGTQVVITMLSDAILRDAQGAPSHDIVQGTDLPLDTKRYFVKMSMVGGFNRTWGLPLPQEWTVRAGSVFVCQAINDIDVQLISRLIDNGIGERRSEGFGRIAVNWQSEDVLQQISSAPPLVAASPVKMNASDNAYIQRIVNRRYRHALDEALVEAINGIRIASAPANSQLSRIRTVARSAMRDGDLHRLALLFDETPVMNEQGEREIPPHALRTASMGRFHAARVGNKRLSDWIRELAEEPSIVWRHVAHPAGNSIADVEPNEDLAMEYAVRLLDGILGKTMAARR